MQESAASGWVADAVGGWTAIILAGGWVAGWTCLLAIGRQDRQVMRVAVPMGELVPVGRGTS